MKKSSSFLQHLVIFGTAVIGLSAGHYLDYLVAIPDHGHRRSLLASTGHGYSRTFLVFAIAAAALSLLAVMTLGFRRSRGQAPAAPSFRWTVLRLSLVQLLAFALLEVIERLLSAGSFDRIATLVLVGAIAQIFVAILGVAILVALGRVAEMMARMFGKKFEKTASASVAFDQEIASSLSSDSPTIRGPPATPAFV